MSALRRQGQWIYGSENQHDYQDMTIHRMVCIM